MWQITIIIGLIILIACVSEIIRLNYTDKYDLFIHEPEWTRNWNNINYKIIIWSSPVFCLSHIIWAIRLTN